MSICLCDATKYITVYSQRYGKESAKQNHFHLNTPRPSKEHQSQVSKTKLPLMNSGDTIIRLVQCLQEPTGNLKMAVIILGQIYLLSYAIFRNISKLVPEDKRHSEIREEFFQSLLPKHSKKRFI